MAVCSKVGWRVRNSGGLVFDTRQGSYARRSIRACWPAFGDYVNSFLVGDTIPGAPNALEAAEIEDFVQYEQALRGEPAAALSADITAYQIRYYDFAGNLVSKGSYGILQ